jgi:hypothetical protein
MAVCFFQAGNQLIKWRSATPLREDLCLCEMDFFDGQRGQESFAVQFALLPGCVEFLAHLVSFCEQFLAESFPVRGSSFGCHAAFFCSCCVDWHDSFPFCRKVTR